ncbi:MAG: hypothetical protein JWN40_3523 [Phycisphaerales bacterium]|jgi:hypothetical protein|nr:hypothetical protein [Phycisphaerales bacterium]
MPSPLDFPARGKVIRVEGNVVVFNPSATTYELRLVNHDGAEMPRVSPAAISCYIRCNARKVWTMPSGGNFVTPIFGPPRVIQGRVRYLEETLGVIQAGVPIIVNWPAEEVAFDLASGPIVPAAIINATILPGATFELATAAVPQP